MQKIDIFVAGDLLWNWYEAIGEEPFPSLADVLYLAGSSSDVRSRLRHIGGWHHQDVQAILAAVDRALGDIAVAAVR